MSSSRCRSYASLVCLKGEYCATASKLQRALLSLISLLRSLTFRFSNKLRSFSLIPPSSPPPSPTPPHPHSLVYPDAKRSHTHVKNTILKFRVRWIGNTKRTQQALKTKTHHTLRVQCQWQKEKERKRYKKPISWAVILTQLLLLCWLLKLCPSADRTPRVCLTKPAV